VLRNPCCCKVFLASRLREGRRPRHGARD
jgi:hypothetical protein